MRNIIFALALLVSISSFGQSKRVFKLQSQNKKFELNFGLDDDKRPNYSLKFMGRDVILESGLGFLLKDNRNMISGFEIINVEFDTKKEKWQPVWGEEREIENNYNEMLVLLNKIDEKTKMNIRFRLFNDSMGFRYEFPEQKNLGSFIIVDEKTEFKMSGDHTAFWIPGDYDTQEYNYTTSKLSEIQEKSIAFNEENVSMCRFSDWSVQTALMMKTNNNLYINIHEAALIEYSAMHLLYDPISMTFESHLTPDANGNMAYMNCPHKTPWRTIIIGEEARDILECRITYNLNDPSKIEDTSWIKPTKYMGVWWEMITGQSTWWYTDELSSVRINETDYSSLKPNKTHAANNKKVMRYIDFASWQGRKFAFYLDIDICGKTGTRAQRSCNVWG